MPTFSATITAQYDTIFSPFAASRFEDALEWLESGGFDAAEVCICDYRTLDARDVKAALDKRNLGCTTISTGQARVREGMTLLDPDSRAAQRITEHIQAAKLLKSNVTIGLLRGAENDTRLLDKLAQALSPCVDAAEKEGVCLILEPINRYETGLINSAEDAVRFIESMGKPRSMGILWDVFHANIEDASFADAIDIMGPLLKHVHLADSNRAFPGFGHTDFTSILQKLRQSGFDGALSFECLNMPDKETVLHKSKGFVQSARQLWEKA